MVYAYLVTQRVWTIYMFGNDNKRRKYLIDVLKIEIRLLCNILKLISISDAHISWIQ